MRLGKWQFRAGLWPTLAMLVLCALFLRLAVWQWDRAQYKRSLLAAYAEQAARKPVSLDALLADSTLESFPTYLKVTALGRYDASRQILLQDMTHDGEVGYEVLTPFVMQAGVILLVDRGWVPVGSDGKSPPPVAVPEDTRAIQGVLGTLPVPGLKLGQPAPMPSGWPKILFYPEMHELTLVYGPKLMTPVLHLGPQEAEGYVREFSPDVGFPPARHLGYAFQWLMLALAVFAVWLVVNLRRGRHGTETSGG